MPLLFFVVLVLIVGFWFTGAILSLLWPLLIGFFAGAIAKFLMPGRDGGGFFMTALLGIAGALTAGLLGHMTGIYQPGETAGFLAAIVGSLILLAGYRLITHDRRPTYHT